MWLSTIFIFGISCQCVSPIHVASSLEQIGIGNEFAIAALVQLLQSTNLDHDTRRQVASSLEQIGIGNENAIATLVQLLQSTNVSDSTRTQAAESLGQIIQNNQHRIAVVKALSGYWQLNYQYYDLAWKCAQNMPYYKFYQAKCDRRFCSNHFKILL